MLPKMSGINILKELRRNNIKYSDAWNYMYQEWIAGSDYVPRNYNPFEVYRNVPYANESLIHEVDIYVPIESIHF
jgi:AraC family transcriptional regulator